MSLWLRIKIRLSQQLAVIHLWLFETRARSRKLPHRTLVFGIKGGDRCTFNDVDFWSDGLFFGVVFGQLYVGEQEKNEN